VVADTLPNHRPPLSVLCRYPAGGCLEDSGGVDHDTIHSNQFNLVILSAPGSRR
jgi:hypothetical protein